MQHVRRGPSSFTLLWTPSNKNAQKKNVVWWTLVRCWEKGDASERGRPLWYRGRCIVDQDIGRKWSMSCGSHEKDNGIGLISHNKPYNEIWNAPQTLSHMNTTNKLVNPALGGDLSKSSTDMSKLKTVQGTSSTQLANVDWCNQEAESTVHWIGGSNKSSEPTWTRWVVGGHLGGLNEGPI